MTDNDVKVTYKAVADFSALYREALKAKAALAAMNKEQAQGDKSSVGSAAAAAAARRNVTSATNDEVAAVNRSTRGKAAERAATNATTDALTAETRARNDSKRAADSWAEGVKRATTALARHNATVDRGRDALGRFSASNRKVGTDLDDTGRRAITFATRLETAVKSLLRIKDSEGIISGSLTRIGQGFSKLSFLALPTQMIGAIAALGGMINPLVAGVTALGAAALGTASSLGTLAGSAVGLVPALGAALGVALALKTAVAGVGAAIKAGGAAQTASAGGGGGSTAAQVQDPYHISATEKVTRAQEAYRRSLQDVKFSEQNLFDARRAYTRQVQDLTAAIEQYTDATKAADAASVESAKENYANVLADSSSTKAQKDAARAAIAQAQSQQEQDAAQNVRNQQDLAEKRSTGREGDQSVVDAKRGVTDAKDNVRDQQINVKNAKYDRAHPVKAGGSSGSKAASPEDQFAAAMAKLAPAAQEFVKWFLKFKDAYEQIVAKPTQQAFFSQFVDDLDRLNGLLPNIRNMLVPIATALGQVVDDLIKMVTGTAWKRDINSFGTDLAPIIKIAGGALESLLNAFRDLTMAGLPFLKDIVGWLAKGAEHFATFIKNGRDTGSIQGYLENVFKVMQKWWDVIKNISATLYNYGKAAGPFGQWLTDGLVKMTGAWRDASERATEPNSPFRKYLKDIEPVLTQIKGLIGDFFRWIAKTSADPKNIKSLEDGIKFIRTDLGPVIGDLLDTLAKSGIAEAFGKALVALAKAIDTLLKNGGSKGLKDLYHIISDLLGAADKFMSTGFGKWLTNALVPPLVVLAGLSFAFGPLFLLFGWIAKLAGLKGVVQFLGALGKGLGRGGAAAAGGADAARAAGAAASAGGAAKAAGGAAKAVPVAARAGEGVAGVMKVVGGLLGAGLLGLLTKGRGVVAGGAIGKAQGAAAASGKNSGVIGSILKTMFGGEREEEAREKAGSGAARDFSHLKDFKSVEGLGGKLFLGYSAYDAIKMGGEAVEGEDEGKGSEGYQEYQKLMKEADEEKDPKKRAILRGRATGSVVPGMFQKAAGNTLLGAVDGGTIGGEILPGAGILPGAVIGSAYGAISSGVSTLGGVGTLAGQIGDKFNPANASRVSAESDDLLASSNPFSKLQGLSGKADSGITGFLANLFGIKQNKGEGGKGEGGGEGAEADVAGGKKGDKNPFAKVAANVSKWWNDTIKSFTKIGKNIGDWWNNNVVKPFQKTAKNVSDWWNDQVVRPAKAFVDMMKRLWQHFVIDPFNEMAQAVGDWWHDNVVKPFQKMAKAIGEWWNDDVVGTFQRIAGNVGDWWHDHVVVPFQKMAKTIGDWWHDHVVATFQRIGKNVGDWWHDHVVVPFQRMAKTIGDWWHDHVVMPFQRMAATIGNWWKNNVVATFQRVAGKVGDWWNGTVIKTFHTVANGIGTAWGKVTGWFRDVATGLTSTWNKYVAGPIKAVTGGIAGFIKKLTHINIGDLLTDAFNAVLPGGGGGGDTGGKGTSGGGHFSRLSDSGVGGQWGSTIKQALQIAGAPQSWAGDIATIIKYESGGNPNAQNNWDSNAKAGHPSQGLMQTIQGTFNAYAGSLRSRGIRDPLANIVAGVNYIQSRYGSPENLAGIKSVRKGGGWIGYAAGGHVKGRGNSDNVDARLMPGEYILNKKAVKKAGVNNLNNFNSGVMTLEQMLSNMGLATGMPRKATAPSAGVGNTFGDINIYNPRAEMSSDSLPRAVRKVAYLKKGK